VPTDVELVLRLLLAAATGAAIGAQREWTGKPEGPLSPKSAADLRTLALISVGAALFAVISEYGFAGGNPSMIAAGVVTGVGFLGAGAILHLRNGVEGLTTAASVWVSAGIGLAAGAGFYFISIIVTVIVLGILFIPHIRPSNKHK
jgi:putative Mg2+ transporter-C (MgtC) family protein